MVAIVDDDHPIPPDPPPTTPCISNNTWEKKESEHIDASFSFLFAFPGTACYRCSTVANPNHSNKNHHDTPPPSCMHQLTANSPSQLSTQETTTFSLVPPSCINLDTLLALAPSSAVTTTPLCQHLLPLTTTNLLTLQPFVAKSNATMTEPLHCWWRSPQQSKTTPLTRSYMPQPWRQQHWW